VLQANELRTPVSEQAKISAEKIFLRQFIKSHLSFSIDLSFEINQS